MIFSVCKSCFTYFDRRKIARTGFVGPGWLSSVVVNSCASFANIVLYLVSGFSSGKSYLAFVLILYGLLSVSEGCSSRSTPKPKPTIGPTPRPNITFHTYACPPMQATWYCLNGATCFTVKIGEHTLYNCECAEGYMGPRCEFKDLDSSYLLSRKQVLLETASIAFGATLAILLVVIVCASLYIRYNRKLKQDQALSIAANSCYIDSHDGSAAEPLKRKPFSRRIPATQLPIVKHSSCSSESSSSPSSQQQQQQQQHYCSNHPSMFSATFQASMAEKNSDHPSYFEFSTFASVPPSSFPSVKNNLDIEIGACRPSVTDDPYPHRPDNNSNVSSFQNHPIVDDRQLHYLLLQQQQNNDKYIDAVHQQGLHLHHHHHHHNNNNSNNSQFDNQEDSADVWSFNSTTLPLWLRIMKKLETLFTFDLPIKRIADKLVGAILAEQKTNSSSAAAAARLLRRSAATGDIVEFCAKSAPVTIVADVMNNHAGGHHLAQNRRCYKVLTVLPAVCIPMEENSNILLLDVKLDDIATSKRFPIIE